MKRLFLFILITSFMMMSGCEPEAPTAAKLDVTVGQLAVTKIVAIGNSLTAGFQSSGLKADFQMHSYPYLIAQQLGKTDDFEQPLIAEPGIGSPAGFEPQKFDGASITQDPLTVDPLLLFVGGGNATLPRPYDNLGIPGADLNDILTGINATGTGNGFFDIVLRNPNFNNTTVLQQAIALQPTLLLLWVGSNDVLGAALAGGGVNGSLLSALITSQSDFRIRLSTMLTQIRFGVTNTALLVANIPDVTDIPYVNMLDIIFINSIPVLFNETFTPIDFDPSPNTLNIPIYTTESQVAHVLLPGLLAYQTGIGVPDSAVLVDVVGLPSGQAGQIEAGMIASGLNPTGIPIPGDMTLTSAERTEIMSAVNGFNQEIADLASTFIYPIIDANAMLNELNTVGIDGLSGNYVLLDPATTAFSLDGVHPNNAGNAVIANAFIDVLNAAPFSLGITKLNIDDYDGQYLGKPMATKLKSSFDGVRQLFSK
jgi:lysophospholipase L1-like esterase